MQKSQKGTRKNIYYIDKVVLVVNYQTEVVLTEHSSDKITGGFY
jgi:hypothetical protein